MKKKEGSAEKKHPAPAKGHPAPKRGGESEHKKPWREVYATVEDIQNFLMDRVLLRHNVITKRVEWREPQDPSRPPLFRGGDWQPISDRVVNSLWAELSATKAVRVQDMYRVIESDFVPEYHPFRYYLEHLPPWNGKDDYLLELSLSVCVKGDEQDQWQFAEYLRKWLVGMVAGWVDDTVVNNVILVLIGEQGSYKTTWFFYLCTHETRAV